MSKRVAISSNHKQEQANGMITIGLFIIVIGGAGGENRTRMYLRTLDFESSASTYFTTPALKTDINIIENGLKVKQKFILLDFIHKIPIFKANRLLRTCWPL